ncbi:homoserine kinase [Paenibacillus thermotolerans]|uniref:homoserine kinase n=1 Tax=Paenibacillus thermotolerans TaxID=3027807 RepID=UPI0023685125|nr:MULTISPECIES: homoserine kinase [unclassified Paenibacillus]
MRNGEDRMQVSAGAGAVRVKVPASSANLGPGFDALGMALNLYGWIEMSPSDSTSFTLLGEHVSGLPTDKSNLLYTIAQRVFAAAGTGPKELNITMYSEIPLTRGLGSSASAIVGALGAANALIGSPFGMNELFQWATEIEGHPDNVGASLFGGIIAAVWDGGKASHVRIEPHPRLEALVAIPAFELSTGKARTVLPDRVSRADAVYNIGHASMLIAALATGNLEAIREAMSDRIHQPYRAPLVPGMEQCLLQAADQGALGAALSGAGPTLLALVDAQSERKGELETFMRATLQEHGVTADMLWLKPSSAGLEVISAEEPLANVIRKAGAPC